VKYAYSSVNNNSQQINIRTIIDPKMNRTFWKTSVGSKTFYATLFAVNAGVRMFVGGLREIKAKF
jgi:ascorbate-specific PTS system EIIC-type component UlaA